MSAGKGNAGLAILCRASALYQSWIIWPVSPPGLIPPETCCEVPHHGRDEERPGDSPARDAHHLDAHVYACVAWLFCGRAGDDARRAGCLFRRRGPDLPGAPQLCRGMAHAGRRHRAVRNGRRGAGQGTARRGQSGSRRSAAPPACLFQQPRERAGPRSLLPLRQCAADRAEGRGPRDPFAPLW